MIGAAQGQGDRLSQPARVRVALHPAQVAGERQGPYPFQVGLVRQALHRDQRRRLGQPQGKAAQFFREFPCPVLVREPGPRGQERQGLAHAEDTDRDGYPERGRGLARAGDHHVGGPAGREERAQPVNVGDVVKYQQALLPVRFQPVPHGRPGVTRDRQS